MSSLGNYSGSSYEGDQSDFKFDGYGKFRFPDGTYYEGNFKQGNFHGKGTIHFPGGTYEATWAEGKEVEGEYKFTDGLVYEHPPESWEYLTPKDRRFFTELDKDIKPAGETQMSNKVPVPELPPGCFDTGDGYYDPKSGNVHDHDTGKVLRKARADEAAWLQRQCRVGTGGVETAAHRASLSSR